MLAETVSRRRGVSHCAGAGDGRMGMSDGIVLFESADSAVTLDVATDGNTVWLSQAQMVELFGRDQSVISRRVGNVFKEGELDRESSVHFLHIPSSDKPVAFYNLDVVISVGYRVKSQRGVEKDESFKGTLGSIYQGFGGQEIYPSLQEKAANLLYLVIKNHAFLDGNKRIAATMFLYFLDRNGALFVNGRKAIDDSTLVAVTVMIAESKPEEKDIMIALVMNFITMGN